MTTLPSDGETGWGDILNTYLTALSTETTGIQSNLNNHAANVPTDPHGDRAYAQSLVSPILSGVNQPNGFVQLNSSGTIPPSLIQQNTEISVDFVGGMYNRIFDCVATFDVQANGSDMSVQIQTAVNACGSAGGGVVWLGPGVFSVANYIYLQDNVHFMMSRGTTIQRIHGVGADCKYIFTNCQFGTSNTPADHIRISGGTIDCVGTQTLTSAATNVFFIQTTDSVIEEVSFYSVFSNPCIEVNGCTGHHNKKCYFDGVGSNSQSSTCPAVRINCSSSSTTPVGLANIFYSNATCRNVHTDHCHTRPTSYSHGCHGALCGSDLTSSGHDHDHIYVQSCGTDYTSSLGNAAFDNGQWTHFDTTGCLFYETAP